MLPYLLTLTFVIILLLILLSANLGAIEKAVEALANDNVASNLQQQVRKSDQQNGSYESPQFENDMTRLSRVAEDEAPEDILEEAEQVVLPSGASDHLQLLSSSSKVTSSSLPTHWEAVPVPGKPEQIYYWNTETDEVSWQLPSKAPSPPPLPKSPPPSFLLKSQ